MCLQETSTWASLVGLPFLLEGVERVLLSEPSLFRAENRMLYSVHCARSISKLELAGCS